MSCSTELAFCVSRLRIQTPKLETKHPTDTKLQKQPAYSEGKIPKKHENFDIAQVMHYSPKQYQYFYTEILKHPD